MQFPSILFVVATLFRPVVAGLYGESNLNHTCALGTKRPKYLM